MENYPISSLKPRQRRSFCGACVVGTVILYRLQGLVTNLNFVLQLNFVFTAVLDAGTWA